MATSHIANAVNSLLDKIAGIPFAWDAYLSEQSNGLIKATAMPDSSKLFQSLAMWNNQPRQWSREKGLPADRPCCYIQVLPGKSLKMGLGITLYPDFVFRVHIIDFQIDGFRQAGGTNGDNPRIGGFDQNMEIFQWRDMVKAELQLFFPVSCGALNLIDEKTDDEHEDVYHYVLDFKTAFRDLKGSILDPDQTSVISVAPPQPAGQFGFDTTVYLNDVDGSSLLYADAEGDTYTDQNNNQYVTQAIQA